MAGFSTEHRKLAAIMFTDMVGYSALSQRNEALALELLEEHRQLLRSVFPKHQGEEIKSTGDGFLVEFASALAAVQCAVEIQKQMRQRNASRSAERRVLIRIGIHLGDVVRRGGDVFGDGVNIAARIEPLAEPGGICVSRAVYEQIENKVEHALVQLSRPALKNIQATVEVYRLVLDQPRSPRLATTVPRSRLLVLGVALTLVGAGMVLFLNWRPQPRLAVEQGPSQPATDPATPAAADHRTDQPVELRVLHSFGPTNAESVNGWGLVTLSRDGFLYGCTLKLGPGGGGAIYRIRTNGGDYAVLHSFDRTQDGAEPTTGVIEGRDGALYGTTFRGGAEDAGTVFRVAKDGSGFRVLHHFARTNDCRNPQSELLEGRDGRLYGTATGGGGNGRGGVFSIAKDGTDYRIVSGLFRGQPDDPLRPVGGLVQSPSGAILGTSKVGGLKNNGTVFQVDVTGRLFVLRSLGLAEGEVMQPEGTLLRAADGWLYGTCTLGGIAGAGGVFRLAPEGGGFAVLHHFGTLVDDARQPGAGLTEAADGTLWGTTLAGGAANLGAVFKLNKDGTGYQVLRSFAAGPGHPARPRSALTPGDAGVFYSATLNGGRHNLGTVFQLVLSKPETASHRAAAPFRR